MTLELGGKQVEFIHVGRNHSDNAIVMLFPEERTLFAVDFISTRRLPFRTLADSYYPDSVDSLRRVEQLDFDIQAPGHGAMGTKQDVADHRRYHEDLYRDLVLRPHREAPTESVPSSGDAAARYSTRANCDVFASPATWSRKMRMRSVLRRSGCVRIQRSVAINGMTPPTRLNCSSFSAR